MRISLLLAGVAMLAMGGAAHADDAAAGDLITVTAERDPGYLVKDTSTATRTDTPLLDIPQSITVIDRQRINDQAFLSIADALRFVPGTTVGQGEGHRDQPTIRGNNSTSSFFVDGLRDDAQYFRDFYNAERLEILKGPNALTFGRGGGGGVINRVSKAPILETALGTNVTVDTWGGWRLAADLNTAISGTVAARLNAVYEQGDSYRQFYEMARYGINPVIGVTLGERGALVIGYELLHDERLVDRGVPSQNGRPVEGFRDTFFGDVDVNRASFDANIVSTALDYELSDALTLRWRGRYGDYDKFYSNLFPAGAVSDGRFNVEAYSDGTQRENLLGQADLVWTTTTGSIGHVVLAGVEYAHQTTAVQRLNGYFSPTSDTLRVKAGLTDPFVPPPVFIRPGTGARSARTVVNSFAVFVQDQITLSEHWELMAGIRYDRFSLDSTNVLATSNASLDRTDNLWSPRLGLIWKPVANASVYGSYSVSFLPQSGDQFASLDVSTAALEPESFTNFEIGGKWDVTPGLNLTAALYRLDRSNTRAPGLTPGSIELTGRQRSQGFEFEANGAILPNWQVTAGFALQDAELLDATTAGPAGRKVPLVPKTQVALWTRYNPTAPLGLGLGVVYQSSSFASISNAVVLPAYTRIDAALFYTLAKGLDMQVNIENLFDAGYFATAHNDNNISPGLPRTARFTIRTAF